MQGFKWWQSMSLMFEKPKKKKKQSRVYRFNPPKKVKGYTPCLNDSCFFTDTPLEYCNVHHVFFGSDRSKSETWGMKVYFTQGLASRH